jgi:hypothetical protein
MTEPMQVGFLLPGQGKTSLRPLNVLCRYPAGDHLLAAMRALVLIRSHWIVKKV